MEILLTTGGWGFAHFNDGKPAADEVLNTCFACHQAVADRDLVFTRNVETKGLSTDCADYADSLLELSASHFFQKKSV